MKYSKSYIVIFMILFLSKSINGAALSEEERILSRIRASFSASGKVYSSTREAQDHFMIVFGNYVRPLRDERLKLKLVKETKKIFPDVFMGQKYKTSEVAFSVLVMKKQAIVDELRQSNSASKRLGILKESLAFLNVIFFDELFNHYEESLRAKNKQTLSLVDKTGRSLLHEFICNRDRYALGEDIINNCFFVTKYSQQNHSYDDNVGIQDIYCSALDSLVKAAVQQVNVPISKSGDPLFGKVPLHLALMIENPENYTFSYFTITIVNIKSY